MDNEKIDIAYHDTNNYFYLVVDGKREYETKFQEKQELINDSYLMRSSIEITDIKLKEISLFILYIYTITVYCRTVKFSCSNRAHRSAYIPFKIKTE